MDDVELQDGKAIIKLSIDAEYDGMVRRDATALLRPRTALKDMFIELNPGSPEAAEATEDFRLPISNTLPDVNPDEFLSALDTDTRQYIKLLLQGAGEGLKGRGNDLRAVLKRFEPTHRDLALVSTETAKRTAELRRLIRSLNLVTRELGSKDDDLAQLVDSASKSFGTLANRREEVSGDRAPPAGHARPGHPRAQPRGGHGARAAPGRPGAARGAARSDRVQPRGASLRTGGGAAAQERHPPLRPRGRARPSASLPSPPPTWQRRSQGCSARSGR